STTFVSSTQLNAAVAAALIANTGNAAITVTSSAGSSNSVTFPINTLSVLNAASNLPSIAPGSLISIYGSNLAASTATAGTIPLPLTLGGASVTINGVTAPLLYASSTQINAQVPFEIQPGTANLVITSGGTVSAGISVTATGPGIFLVQ